MRNRRLQVTRLALAGGIAGALVAFTPAANGADQWHGNVPVTNVVEYQISLDREQAKLDRQQADLDRQQAALDRRKARWRSEVADATWRFRMLDADDDATVTDKEANAMPMVDRQFDSLDTDDNGRLTAREFMAISLRVGQ